MARGFGFRPPKERIKLTGALAMRMLYRATKYALSLSLEETTREQGEDSRHDRRLISARKGREKWQNQVERRG